VTGRSLGETYSIQLTVKIFRALITHRYRFRICTCTAATALRTPIRTAILLLLLPLPVRPTLSRWISLRAVYRTTVFPIRLVRIGATDYPGIMGGDHGKVWAANCSFFGLYRAHCGGYWRWWRLWLDGILATWNSRAWRHCWRRATAGTYRICDKTANASYLGASRITACATLRGRSVDAGRTMAFAWMDGIVSRSVVGAASVIFSHVATCRIA